MPTGDEWTNREYIQPAVPLLIQHTCDHGILSSEYTSPILLHLSDWNVSKTSYRYQVNRKYTIKIKENLILDRNISYKLSYQHCVFKQFFYKQANISLDCTVFILTFFFSKASFMTEEVSDNK